MHASLSLTLFCSSHAGDHHRQEPVDHGPKLVRKDELAPDPPGPLAASSGLQPDLRPPTKVLHAAGETLS